MTMYGAEAQTELLNTSLDVTNTPQNLPGMAVVNRGRDGFQTVYPGGPNQGQVWSPDHAYINVEGGAVRVKCDGSDPDAGMGTLYAAGSVIDWSNVLQSYNGMLKRFRVVREASTVAAKLTISFRS